MLFMREKQNKKTTKISVIGAGSWGGTIAWHISKRHKVNLWTVSQSEYLELTKNKKLIRPIKVKINKNIYVTKDLNFIAKNSDLIIFAVPASVFKQTAIRLKKLSISKKVILLSATKGIIKEKEFTPSLVLKKCFKNNPIAVLSGPNIALDIILKSPVISVVASKNIVAAKAIQNILSTEEFRVYTNNDIIGVEISGALKNIIAIASGMCDGFGYNISSKAALISRGLIEMARIAVKQGAQTKTLLSSACIGDLIATSCSTNSRNYRVGYGLSKGKKLNQILKELGQVAEGIDTAKSVYYLTKKHKIYAPITTGVYNVVAKNHNPKSELKKLLKTKPAKDELNI